MKLSKRLIKTANNELDNNMCLELFNFLKTYLLSNVDKYKDHLHCEEVKSSIYKNSFEQLDNYLKRLIPDICTSRSVNLAVAPIISKYIKLYNNEYSRLEQVDDILKNVCNKYLPDLFTIIKTAYTPYIKELRKEYIPQDLSSDELNYILHLLYKYVFNHLNDIISTLPIRQNKQGFYKIDWAGQDLDAYSLFAIIAPFTEYMSNHFEDIINSFNLSIELVQLVLKNKDKINDIFISNNVNLIRKMRNILIQQHKPIQDKLYKKFLEQNDDHLIGKDSAVKIDFNVLNDYIRERPVIIIKDTFGKDYVIFGHLGDSHGRCINTNVKAFIRRKHIEQDTDYLGYAYLVRDVAFVENYMHGYSREEQVNILKNDPRIKKVYTTLASTKESGGYITRLANFCKS